MIGEPIAFMPFRLAVAKGMASAKPAPPPTPPASNNLPSPQALLNELERVLAQKAKVQRELNAAQEEIARLHASLAALSAPTAPQTRIEFCIQYNATQQDLERLTAENWRIRHLQFDASGRLNVVFWRKLSTKIGLERSHQSLSVKIG